MKRLLSTGLLATAVMGALAQHIDFDLPGKQTPDKHTEPNFTSWAVPRAESDTKTFENGVTITITAGGAASAVGSNWSKAYVEGRQLMLIADECLATNLENGNLTAISDAPTSLILTIDGLTPGNHTLRAYHNNSDLNQTQPDIAVSVNGSVVATGLKFTSGAESYADAGASFISFTATEGQPVVIAYSTVLEAGKTYTNTRMMLNGLEFDVEPKSALDPSPANYDFHAGDEEGTVSFAWTPAEGTARHRLFLGTDSAQVAMSTSIEYEGTEAAYVKHGLTPLQRYWWRVDEVDADGTVYKGKAWAFQPCRLAFPGAEGYGRYAIGGRGGTVYHVTSLLDDADLPGTFRYGITRLSGPRTIVFDVAGTIYLKSRLTCSDRFVTIAGQTAPANGIMFRGAPFGMASDGITRHLRMRRGHILNEDDANKGLDGLGMAGNDHAIMDHCSISWTIDEGFSSRGAKNITLQRTMIAEALNVAGHPNYGDGKAHGFAATIGGGQAGGVAGSFHHNLLAHNEGRNWSISGGLDGAGYYDGGHDVFNNVVYNWGGRATDGGSHEMNFVANYYKVGPADGTKMLLNAQLEGTGKGSQSYYVSGNIRENLNGSKTKDKLNETYRYSLYSGQTLDWTVFVDEPFFPGSFATVESAEAAFKNVLSDVGCNLPAIDRHDRRMIQETLDGTCSTRGSRSGKRGLIDSEEDEGCEGFDMEKLGIVEAQRPADWDTDQDGIPDWFEAITGTHAGTPNNNDDRDGDLYTDLEEYLNWVAEPHFLLQGDEEVTVDLRDYFAGYKSLADIQVKGASVSDGMLCYRGKQRGLHTATVTVSEDGISLSRVFHFAVSSNSSGIDDLPADTEAQRHAAVYNLAGQRVHPWHKGILIKNNRKYLK